MAKYGMYAAKMIGCLALQLKFALFSFLELPDKRVGVLR